MAHNQNKRLIGAVNITIYSLNFCSLISLLISKNDTQKQEGCRGRRAPHNECPQSSSDKKHQTKAQDKQQEITSGLEKFAHTPNVTKDEVQAVICKFNTGSTGIS